MDWMLQILDERKINVPFGSAFEEVLLKLKKADLKRITDAHGLTRTASLTKARLYERISEALGNKERLEYILYGMDDVMLSDFMMLAEQEYTKGEDLMSMAAGPLLDLGYIYPVMKDGQTVLFMPEVVKEAYKQIDKAEFSEAKARFDLIYLYEKGAVSLYGVCDFPHLVGLFNSQQEFEVTAEEALNTLICKMTFQDSVVSYGPLMVHPALLSDESDEDLKILVQVQGDQPFYEATKEEMMAYGSDQGYFTPELEAVGKFLESQLPEAEVHAIVEDIGGAFSYAFAPKSALLSLEMRGLALPDFETSQQFFALVEAAYQNARTWELKGHTPAEKAGNRASKKPVVVPTSAPIRKEKVGRNDPCPCGSGKKFKKCCN